MGAMNGFRFRAALLAVAAFQSPQLFACGHQSPNPLFLSAQARMPALLSSRAGDRAALEKEWSELRAEQRRLWDLAGRIDEKCLQGEISPELPGYLRDLGIWEQRLRRLLETVDSVPPTEAPPKSAPRTSGSALALPSLAPDEAGPEPLAPARSGQGVDEVQFGRSRGASRKPAPSPAVSAKPSPAGPPEGEPPQGLL